VAGLRNLLECHAVASGLVFRLAITDDASDDEIGIVEHRSERMAQRIAQFAALVNRAWTLRRSVAGNSSGKRKLDKELPKPASSWLMSA
jgi:hypothetical protein